MKQGIRLRVVPETKEQAAREIAPEDHLQRLLASMPVAKDATVVFNAPRIERLVIVRDDFGRMSEVIPIYEGS